MPSGAEHFDDLLRRASARVGTTVDEKWKLEALIGVGGMAAVYAGVHRNGKRGAVKILHQEEALDPSVKARFLREGFVANKVGHSGIASVLDDDEAPDGTVYLVMELLDGESLETRCPPGKTMATGDVLAIVNQLLDVLAAAHDHGIVHRDLKPSNLFLLPDGTLKVLDFGIARLRELAQGSAKPIGTTLSALGTPGFMPPEQARGRWDEVDGRSDIWAVGATMFVLLTGKALHEEGTLNEQLLAAMTKPCPPMAEAAPSLPAEVGAIIDRALAFKAADRWPDASSMQAAVRDAYCSLTGRPISFTGGRLTPRLSHPGVDPDLVSAPTLAAAPTPSGSAPRASSSKPVVVPAGSDGALPITGGAITLGGSRAAKWLGAGLLIGAGCIGAGIFAILTRHGDTTAHADTSSPASAALPPRDHVVPESVDPPSTATASAAATGSASAVVASASASASGSAEKTGVSPPQRNSTARPKPSSAGSVRAAPSNDVDIFDRRR